MGKLTLKAARINCNYTQAEAAEKIGVSKDTIGNWERFKSYPNADKIKKIESVYKIKYDDIRFAI